MPRQTRRRRLDSEPEGSWVMDGDSDASSLARSSDASSDQDEPDRTPARSNLRRRGKSSGHRAAAVASPHEPELIMPSLPASPCKEPSHAPRSTPVRQRKQYKASSITLPPASRRQPADTASEETFRFYLKTLRVEVIQPLARFVYSIFAYITYFLKPVLALLLAVWIVVYLGRYALNTAIARTLTPICAIPGMDYLNLPFCEVQPSSGPVEFDQLMTVQSAFEDVLTSSSGGVSLPLDMKRSESSIRDLKHVVQYSALPSRNELVFEFGGFIETARQAASDLTHFNSRVGRAVDQVISTNRWTLQVIDGVAEKEASKGSVSRFFAETLFYPFQFGQVTELLLFDQYLKHTRAIEEQIADLIVEAQALLGILQNLDDRLDVIHGITTRDGVSVKGSRDELFEQLWTKLGGNRSSKKKHDDQLHLLKQVSGYRKVAWEHVSGMMLKLQSIAAGLEDLRERVAAPDVLGHRPEIPLKLHIDNIEGALLRLDSQRIEARNRESEYQRRAIDKDQQQQQLQLP